MKFFKNFFILFIFLFLFFDDVCCFRFPGRRRKSSSGSSSSYLSSNNSSGYVESDVELSSKRIFIVFKEGLLETESRNYFFTRISDNCTDRNFKEQCLTFALKEAQMIFSLFQKASEINLNPLRICTEKEVCNFNKRVCLLNVEFGMYMEKKERCYHYLCKYVCCEISDSFFMEAFRNPFLLQYKLLISENMVMKLDIEQSLKSLETFCQREVSFD